MSKTRKLQTFSAKKVFPLRTLALLWCACVSTNVLAANEVMRDRCSAEVAIPKSYDGKPGQPGTILLRRSSSSAWTEWSEPFTVELGPGGRVRWWCHSTKGNWALSGAHALTNAVCNQIPVADGVCKEVGGVLVPNPESAEGWTAERSRCRSRSNHLRARLGPSRKLQIECLPKQNS